MSLGEILARKIMAAAANAPSKSSPGLSNLDAAILKAYPKGLPSWVAQYNLTPTYNLNTGALQFKRETSNNTTVYNQYGELLQTTENAPKQIDPIAILASIAVSFALPGVGSAIAAQLVTSGVMTAGLAAEAVGLAIASTAAGVAQGKSFEDALKNSVVNVAVNAVTPVEVIVCP